ncbi:MAG: hypothetical protein H6662_16260 [Ardenticatenaceae bacterium]|nr:hypothetical protein [Ardenticatenaceae bacterium]MCB9005210.1 hypothetical protein [Ardenticatenaceae bacterium]
MIMNVKSQQAAILRVLYSALPIRLDDRFVQIRRWETADGDSSDLIVEYGREDENGDLQTECQVLPFYMTVQEALATVGI